MNLKKSFRTLALSSAAIVISACAAVSVAADTPDQLNDLQIAHVAYTADNIDIQYAHLALALSDNSEVQEFAKTMIRDHEAVNAQALALLEKLGAQPEENFLSQSLVEGSKELIDELSQLRGEEFDKRYAENELSYHKSVNNLVENAFIPNIENAEVKSLFEAGLTIFKAHEVHAEMMVKKLNES